MRGGPTNERPDPDEIDRRLRELTGEINTVRIREPSHAERLAAAPRSRKRTRRRQGSRLLTTAIVILVIAAGGTITWFRAHHSSFLSLGSGHASPSVRAVPETTVKQTPTPSVLNAPPADPFAGTPADTWASGATGITIPAARAHGSYSASQVHAAYETTRELLVAGDLNWPTLRGGYPASFASLLTPQQRAEFVAGLNKRGFAKGGAEQSTRTWVTSFAPSTTRFAATTVKVRGTMSASLIAEAGVTALRVSLNFLFVYAVEPPGLPANWMRVVQQRYGHVDFAAWSDPGGALEPWYTTGWFSAGGRCGVDDGYIHPEFPQGPPPKVHPSGQAVDPYVLATPASGATCRPVTRT